MMCSNDLTIYIVISFAGVLLFRGSSGLLLAKAMRQAHKLNSTRFMASSLYRSSSITVTSFICKYILLAHILVCLTKQIFMIVIKMMRVCRVFVCVECL